MAHGAILPLHAQLDQLVQLYNRAKLLGDDYLANAVFERISRLSIACRCGSETPPCPRVRAFKQLRPRDRINLVCCSCNSRLRWNV